MIKEKETYVVEIEKQDDFGNGIARIDDFLVFVEKGLEKEIVKIEITRVEKRYAYGKVIEWVRKSDTRKNPECPYYEVCGGCQVMHQEYLHQLKWKEAKVKEILEKFGGLKSVPILPIVGKSCFYYRNKVIFHGNHQTLGFYQQKTNSIVEIDTCMIADQKINEVYHQILEFLNENRETIIHQVMIRKTSKEEVMVVLEGKVTQTKVGLIYMENIVEDSLIREVSSILEKIDIDGILDSGYLKKYLVKKNSIFPTIQTTERPDLVSMALLEGKVGIIVDNSPYVLILPCFFIDLFHTPDDYYQKTVNISFIRMIRLLAFIIAIFIPAYYIAITTHNHDSVTTDLLLNFLAQRSKVPFPALVEGLIMTVSFEILRESDMRMASTMGTAVSILGGLVLGDAAVSAGIISPIMIIVVAISAISGLAFTSIELTSAIRFWRIFLMFLAATLGIYGIFLGLILLVTKLTGISSFHKPYLAPFSPFIKSEQKDAILKINHGNQIKRRNPLLTTKNRIRGR